MMLIPKKSPAEDRRILIIGGSGMLGRQMPFGYKPTRNILDVCNERSVEDIFAAYKPGVVLHLAALTDKKKCEEDPPAAYALNMWGTYTVARAARKHGTVMVYMSTSYVFDGFAKEPYAEDSIPHPLNVYGATKLIGEHITRDLVPNHLILRLGLLYGGARGTAHSFIDRTAERLVAGEPVTEIANRYCSLTHVGFLVKTLEQLLQEDGRGTYHVASSGPASYYEIAQLIHTVLGSASVLTQFVHDEKDSYAIKRGGFEVLASSRISAPSWQEQLAHYLQEEY